MSDTRISPLPPLKVFLCHAKEDVRKVGEIYQWLVSIGVTPWWDEEDLLPGIRDWKSAIQRAQRGCHATFIFLSANSVHKIGFVQKEIREALDIAEEKPEDFISVIPVLLDDCQVPDVLSHIQWQPYKDEANAKRRLLKSLRQIAAKNNCDLPSVPAALPNAQRLSRNEKDGAELIWIPSGNFIMGSNEREDEVPPRLVFLDGFFIYKVPVTWNMFMMFCRESDYPLPASPPWGRQSDHPVVNVSWEDAMAYSQWAGATLPTEAQCERAARGKDGRKYPWGEEWDTAKCVNRMNSDTTKPVGSKPEGASPDGVLDLAGNIWEWCLDAYDADFYKSAPSRNPFREGQANIPSTLRVSRGGSWYSENPGNFRTSIRLRYVSDFRVYGVGFRCVMIPKAAS